MKVESERLLDFAECLQEAKPRTPARIALNENQVKRGLGKLVLTVVELLRELLERQAIRRIEAGSLTDTEIERLGTAFMELSEEVQRLKVEFGIQDEDLNLDLGPLGKLL